MAPPMQEKLVENVKKGGLDKSTAQRVLDMWKQTGASDEEGLKKLLVRRCALVNVLGVAQPDIACSGPCMTTTIAHLLP